MPSPVATVTKTVGATPAVLAAAGAIAGTVGAAIIPHVEPPPPAIGITKSAPLNHLMGIGEAALTNGVATQNLGDEISKAAIVVNVAFQFIKQLPFINQNLLWPVITSAIGIGLFVLKGRATGGELDAFTTILNGGAAGFLAVLNYHSMRVAGINILPPAGERASILHRAGQMPTEIAERLQALTTRGGGG
jgi:hypothetical protein